MIVRMKKITVIVSEREKEAFLDSLRNAGVVHIKHLTNPASAELLDTENKITTVKKAIDLLPETAGEKQKTKHHESDLLHKAHGILDLQTKKENLEKNIYDTENGITWYMPWGKFSPKEIKDLRNQGIFIKLYKLHKNEFKELKERENIFVIKKEKSYFFIAALFYKEETGLPFEEIKIPSETPGGLEKKLELYNRDLNKIEETLREQAYLKPGLENYLANLEKQHRFLEVFYGMRTEEQFSLLQGFCPEIKVEKVTALVKENNIGYLIEKPDIEEETPTLIKNPGWLETISPLFKFINTLPGYNEFDVSFVFLIFFSLFFAVIVGDAGYGILFCLTTWITRKKLKYLSPEPFRLMYLLGFATVIWGAVTGTWFGFEQIARLPFLNSLVINRISSFSEDSQNIIMYMCFILGAVHLTVAHLMRFIRTINSIQSQAQIGWILMLWGLFFLAGTLVINRPYPHFAIYLLIIGIVMVLVFSNFQKNILKGILLSLVDTLLGTTGSFSDIISYLRLFAVGSAGVAIAGSFNSMALKIGFGNFLTGLSAAFILFFAHVLNIALCFLAVIVHGLRLNMLEFSGHLGMQWSGIKYEPFK